jgi:hypothetical protein
VYGVRDCEARINGEYVYLLMDDEYKYLGGPTDRMKYNDTYSYHTTLLLYQQAGLIENNQQPSLDTASSD